MCAYSLATGREKYADPFRSFFTGDQSSSSSKIITKLPEKPRKRSRLSARTGRARTRDGEQVDFILRVMDVDLFACFSTAFLHVFRDADY